jgi:signal peptidase I
MLRNLPFVAAIVAFLMAAIGVLAALQQPVLAIFALVPLMAGVGILRKRVWSAYGFALFELAQLAVMPFTLPRMSTMSTAQVVFIVGLNVVLALLFFLAGRSLAASGAARGLLFPWIAAACVFTLPLFFLRALVIPSGGMENTLLIGDRVMTRVFPRVQPAQGDIVVFYYPIDRRQVFVKRVIGLPGDRIRIASKTVYRNGIALAEPYAVHKFDSPIRYRDNFPGDPAAVPQLPDLRQTQAIEDMLRNHVVKGDAVVPAGKYFVLGDNRDNSLDSRYWGFLDVSDVIGKPILIYDSSEPGTQGGLRHTIRWRRLFKLL